MKFSDLVKIAAVGALVYGAYKLGEKQSQKKSNIPVKEPLDEEFEVVEVEEDKSEEQVILELIENLKKKPNKTAKDKNTIELLEIKLKQLRK
jgi:hypothetical protein